VKIAKAVCVSITYQKPNGRHCTWRTMNKPDELKHRSVSMNREVWIPRELSVLPVLEVIPNGSTGTYRARPVDGGSWEVKSLDAITVYYRQATKEEATELLPEAA
jgi:hypothetical protein